VEICGLCGYRIRHSVTCVRRSDSQVPFGKEEHSDWALHLERCPSCGVAVDGYHHPGCDIEECSDCHNRVVLCKG